MRVTPNECAGRELSHSSRRRYDELCIVGAVASRRTSSQSHSDSSSSESNSGAGVSRVAAWVDDDTTATLCETQALAASSSNRGALRDVDAFVLAGSCCEFMVRGRDDR